MRRLLLLLAPLLMAQTAPAPLVPEGIHSIVQGEQTMCGVNAASAQQFQEKVKFDSRFSLALTNDQFLVYATPDSMLQFVFSRPGYTAHPLATCRHTYEQDGALLMKRDMRCDDTRERCDRAFLEFRDLDRQFKEAVQQKVRE